MKTTITIPDELLTRKCVQYEPTGEFRRPKEGEWCLTGRYIVQADHDWKKESAIILRRKWTWPEWLDAERIADNGAGAFICLKDGSTWTVEALRWFLPALRDLPPIEPGKPLVNPKYVKEPQQ